MKGQRLIYDNFRFKSEMTHPTGNRTSPPEVLAQIKYVLKFLSLYLNFEKVSPILR